MPFFSYPYYFFQYIFKREISRFFLSISIRRLAVGMVLIFEPIYLYFYFDKSLSLTILFFGLIHGLYGLIVVFGGKIMAKIGLKHAMLFSHFFFFGYYLCLFFLSSQANNIAVELSLLLPLAMILRVIGMMFFWPAYHTDFVRFSEKNHRGLEVGKLNVAVLIPVIISPLIGGWVLAAFGYPILFTIVLVTLFASTIPLFLSKEVHEVYTDSYQEAWARIFKKENKNISLAFAANGMEVGISIYLWPLFMFILAIEYTIMGGIISFATAMVAIFSLYIGKISDTSYRFQLLKIGSFLTSLAWIIKYFVISPFTAFLAHTLYRIFKASAFIPFQSILYDKAFLKGAEADEFIIYREIILNVSRGILFVILAGVFLVTPKINIAFILAALFSLGFMLLGKSSKPKL